MLPENLPKCVCDAHNYRGGGGSFGGSLSQSSFTCNRCDRQVAVLSGYGVSTHVFYPDDVLAPLGQPFDDWANSVLLPTWRTFGRAIKKREDELYTERKLTHIAACEARGLDPTVMKSYYDLPKDVQEELNAAREQMRKDVFASVAQPLPPKLPDDVRCFVCKFFDEKPTWVEVDHDESAKLTVPRDPIALDHETYWEDVFDKLVSVVLKQPLLISEIPNGYYADQSKLQPWFKFKTPSGLRVKLGPRKRVDSVQVESDAPFDVTRIAALAKRDETSYWADGGWHAWDQPTATKVEFHAWTKDKLLEYLAAVLAPLDGGQMDPAETALRELASYLSVGGYNDVGLVPFDAEKYRAKIVEGIDMFVAMEVRRQRERVRALPPPSKMLSAAEWEKWREIEQRALSEAATCQASQDRVDLLNMFGTVLDDLERRVSAFEHNFRRYRAKRKKAEKTTAKTTAKPSKATRRVFGLRAFSGAAEKRTGPKISR